MKAALSILALAALTACGGGGGGSGGGFAPIAVAPAVESHPEPVSQAPRLTPVDTGCYQPEDNHIACDLVPGEIGPSVAAGSFLSFVNLTGQHLQINEVNATTGEREFWSEYCIYYGELKLAQSPAGWGEAGCATKNKGEDYAPIRFGEGAGLSIPPGQGVILNAHTEPSAVIHTYSLKVSVQASGLSSWRQPQVDQVIFCDDQLQSTVMSPWQNTTGGDLHLTGASIYSETPSSKTPNTMSGAACIYVLTADGSTKYQNCDPAIRTRGEVSFPLVTIAPGEFVAAQATNSCSVGGHWDWAAFLRVW